MSELVTTLGAVHISCTANTNVSFTRGLRGVINAGGTFDLAGASELGQVVADIPTPAAGGVFLGARIGQSGSIPANVVVNANVGDIGYTAANGQFTTSATNASRLGVFTQAALAGGVAVLQPD